jgi:hypothetical protein
MPVHKGHILRFVFSLLRTILFILPYMRYILHDILMSFFSWYRNTEQDRCALDKTILKYRRGNAIRDIISQCQGCEPWDIRTLTAVKSQWNRCWRGPKKWCCRILEVFFWEHFDSTSFNIQGVGFPRVGRRHTYAFSAPEVLFGKNSFQTNTQILATINHLYKSSCFMKFWRGRVAKHEFGTISIVQSARRRSQPLWCQLRKDRWLWEPWLPINCLHTSRSVRIVARQKPQWRVYELLYRHIPLNLCMLEKCRLIMLWLWP